MRRAIETTMTTAIVALLTFAPDTGLKLAAANEPASAPPVAAHTDPGFVSPEAKAAEIAERARLRREWIRSFVLTVLPPILGFALFIGAWALFAQTAGSLPSPAKTWTSAMELFSKPFYIKGPND